MKVYQRMLFIIVIIIGLNKTNGQVSLGPKTGLNLGNLNYSDTSRYSPVFWNKTGLIEGLVLDIGVVEFLSIQPEINLIQKGYNSTSSLNNFSSFSQSVTTKITLNYLELSIMIKLYYGSKRIKFNLLFGPNLGYAFEGKYKQTYHLFFSSKKNEGLINFEDDKFNRIDLGLNFGLGTSFYISNGYLFLDARYQLGLSDLSTEDGNYVEAYNKGIQFSIGYMWFLSKQQ